MKRNKLLNKKAQNARGLFNNSEWTEIVRRASSRGIAVIRNGKVIGAGVNFARIVGYNYPEVMGMLIVDFVAPKYRYQVSNNIKSFYEISYDTYVQRKDGALLPVVARGRYIPNSDYTIWMVAVMD